MQSSSVRCLTSFGTLLLLVADPGSVQSGDGRPQGSAAASLSQVLRQQTEQRFRSVLTYVEQQPEANDRLSAVEWLLLESRDQGLESKLIGLGTELLGEESFPDRLKPLVMEVRCLGLAERGEVDEALQQFDRLISSIRLRDAYQSVELAKRLGGRLLIRGDVEAARAVYERLSTKFFLNPQVRAFCEVRLARLELIGRPAPAFSLRDLEGNPVSLTDWQGKVIIVDFWATNCAPCLEEFPAMKRLYAEQHAHGLEVVGFSLDETVETVASFDDEWQLPWELVWARREIAQLREVYHVPLIPAVFVIDRKGRIAFFDVTGPALDRAIKVLVAQES